MSKASLQLNLPPAEVKRSHRESEARPEAVKELHSVPLRMEKARFGAAVKCAIGDRPMKQFGHEGLMSEVCSGAKVPDYLARIYADDGARRRFALALLSDDDGVRVRTVVEFEERKAG